MCQPTKNRASDGDSGSISSTLLERVQAQRPEAWERLVDLYGPVVYRWCRCSGVSCDDAADLTQEVFGAVARSVRGFCRKGPNDSFRAWLATITRNKIRDHFRRRQGRPEATGGTDAQRRLLQFAEPGEPSTGSQIEVDAILSRRALDLVRSEFENRTWEAFWRTVVDGLTPADAAEELGMSLVAVYQAKSRVLRRLRREVGDLIE
ncbi:MAG: RNA polymerase sigma factor [Planctomycetota bacterium]